MTSALIVLAHGSRRKSSELEIKTFAEALEKEGNERFDYVRAAFIQFCPPPFIDVVRELVEKGVGKIVIIPFFISKGNHVVEDIPALMAEAKEKYPHLNFSVTPHFGEFSGLKQLVMEEAIKV